VGRLSKNKVPSEAQLLSILHIERGIRKEMVKFPHMIVPPQLVEDVTEAKALLLIGAYKK
jgi:hypothetical protein